MILKSPNYPYPYGNYENCFWSFTFTKAKRVRIDFQYSLEGSLTGTCEHDYIEIFDGVNENSKSIAKFCGEGTTGTIISTGSSLYLRFVSDSAQDLSGDVKSGFSIRINTTGNIYRTKVLGKIY